jgi:hypothetical protein
MTAPIRSVTAEPWTVPASLRHALIGLASEVDARTVPGAALSKLRIAFDLAFDGIEARRLHGGAEAYLRENVRLTDSAVAGLLHVARAAVDGGAPSIVAPIACVAIGNYAARLPETMRVGGVLLLVPTAPAARVRGEQIAGFNVQGLEVLGLDIECVVRTVPALVSLLEDFPSLTPMVERRRFIRGRYDLFVELEREVGKITAAATGEDKGSDLRRN